MQVRRARGRPALQLSAIALSAAMLLAGCGGSSTGVTQQASETASSTASATPAASTGTQILSFDAGATQGGGGSASAPLDAYCWVTNGGSMFELERLVDQGLIAYTADLNGFVGEIAQSWTVKGDTVTFHLRKNAKWQDGTPLTAKDVLFTLNTLANPQTVTRDSIYLTSIKGYNAVKSGTAQTLSGVTAPDPYTVVITLNHPDSRLLAGLAQIEIMPEHILGSVPKDKICQASYWTQNRIGSGPYQMVKLVPGQRIELKAFNGYFLGAPKIQRINLLLFSSAETSLAAFAKQSSMVAPLTPNDLNYVKSLSFAKIEQFPAGVGEIFINTKSSPFNDVRVRQAISYAIDRQALAKDVYKGTATPAWSEFPWLTSIQPANLNHYNYDPAKAKQLLQQAGWHSTQTYTLWYYYPDQITANAMQAVQQYLAAVGINVKPRQDSGGALTQAHTNGTWQLEYGSLGATADPSYMSEVWGCAVQKTWDYCNSQWDSVMQSAASAPTQQLEQQYYQQAISMLNQAVPSVWLLNRQDLVAVNKALNTGGKPAWGPGFIFYHNYAELWTLSGNGG